MMVVGFEEEDDEEDERVRVVSLSIKLDDYK